VLAGVVLIGGIKRLGAIAGKLVPFMAIAYIAAGTAVLIVNSDKIPKAMI
jgi:AGCS family alanine or glycine:cation symporter